MSLADVRARFLARTEQIAVRIPFEEEPVTRLRLAQERRAAMHADYERAKADYEKPADERQGRRKLSDPAPTEPDYTEADAAIELAERQVDECSIKVLLEWKPGVYQEAYNWGRQKDEAGLDRSIHEVHTRIAAGFYVRAEGYEDGNWADLDLSWQEVVDHISDADLAAVAAAAASLCTATDAAPFVKRGKTSAAT